MKVQVFHLTTAARAKYMDNCGIAGSELKDTSLPTVDDYDRNVKWLFDSLKAHGRNGTDEDAAYFLDEWANPTCFICVEVSDGSFIDRDLVIAVHRSVLRMDPHYRVHIINAQGFLDDDFDVFVEKEQIYVYAPIQPYLLKLGLNADSLEY